MNRTGPVGRLLAVAATLGVFWAASVTGADEAKKDAKTTPVEKMAESRVGRIAVTPSPGEGKVTTVTEKKVELPQQVKCAELKHADPDDIRQILTQTFGGPAPQPGGIGASKTNQLRFAIDPRTKAVFLRGSARDVETAAALVAELDAEPGGANEERRKSHFVVFRLRNARTDDVLAVLATLDLQRSVVPLRKSNMLLVPQNDPSVEGIRTVVERLDAAVRQTPKSGSAAPKKSTPPSE